MSAANKSGNDTAAPRRGFRCLRTLIAAPVLAVALLVVVVGSASATGEDDPPVVVSADQPGSLGMVSTAQSEVETNPETEPRLVGRESSSRVDAVVISLWSIAAGMTVMLGLFLWHTSPRRRLRLARRRSTEMYEAEREPLEDAAATASADEGTAEVPEPSEEGTTEVPEPSEEGSAEVPELAEEGTTEVPEAVEEGSAEVPEASDVEEVLQVVEAPASTEQSEPEVVLPPVEEEPVIAPDLPPVWEDEAEQSDGEDEGEQSDGEDDAAQAAEGEGERAGEEAKPARDSRTDVPPRPGEAAREGASRLWLRLRHTLGLD